MKFLMALIFTLSAGVSFAKSEAVEGAKKDYAAAKAEVSAQLDALDKKIDELKASTAAKSTAAKEKALKEAEETRAKARAQYESMKESSSGNWQSFKKKLARSIDKVNARAQKALKE